MYRIALKMLREDRARFIGIVLSLSFSAIIISQQASTFFGIMIRTYGTITDTPQADIWVMDPNVRMIDDILPLRDTDLFRVRCIDGVLWAVPFFKGIIQANLLNGQFQTCILIGIDDSTLIGAPHTMLEGRLEDLRGPDAVIINYQGSIDKLSYDQAPGKPSIPMQVGNVIELNDLRAKVVGICDLTRTFQSQPVIYTTYNRALTYSPTQRKQLSFILVKSDGRMPVEQLCKKISETTHFAAYTKEQFKSKTMDYYLRYTGIPINFGFSVFLGLLVGAGIAGLIFFNFITENLKYLALFAAMGASRWRLVKMTMLQALWVALLGWGIGTGGSALIGFLARNTEFSFHLTWLVFLGTGIIIFSICIVALILSIAKIFKIELGTMFN